MKKKAVLLIFMVMSFLMGMEDSFIQITLIEENDKSYLEMDIVREDIEAEKEVLLASGYIKVRAAFRERVEAENVYAVLPQAVVDKFRLEFSDGVFLVNKESKAIPLDSVFVEAYISNEGLPLEWRDVSDKRKNVRLPFEDFNPANIVGVVLLTHEKPWWEWVDIVNVFHDDSDASKALYLDFESSKKSTKNKYICKILSEESKKSDLGDGGIAFGLLNLNSAKTRDQVYERASNPGWNDNYGCYFMLPFAASLGHLDASGIEDRSTYSESGVSSLAR